jgi:hypothetical protein
MARAMGWKSPPQRSPHVGARSAIYIDSLQGTAVPTVAGYQYTYLSLHRTVNRDHITTLLVMAVLTQYDYLFAIGTIFAFLDAWNIGSSCLCLLSFCDSSLILLRCQRCCQLVRNVGCIPLTYHEASYDDCYSHGIRWLHGCWRSCLRNHPH